MLTPLGPLVCPVMIHKKKATRNSWYFRSKEGQIIGTALYHYRYKQVIPRDTKAVSISDTVDFLHQYITAPTVTPADRILHSINTLKEAIKETPITVYGTQLKSITALRDACHRWESRGTPEKLPDPIAPRNPPPCSNFQGCPTRLFSLRYLFHLQGCKRRRYTSVQLQGWIPLL